MIAACLNFALTGFAHGVPKYFAKNASKEYKQKLEKTGVVLQRMEARLNKIEKDKMFSKEDMLTMDADLNQYGNDMNNLYNEAVDRVKEAKDTNGKSGGNEEFLYFEDMAKGHEKRMKALADKHAAIDENIKKAKIKPNKKTIDEMTPEEKKKFKDSLTPEGKKEIEKTYPKMTSNFNLSPSERLYDFAGLGDERRFQIRSSVNEVCSATATAMSDFLVSPLEASAAYGCYLTCSATLGLACATCVISAGGVVYDAYITWKNNMKSCSCSWYNAWCCAKKTYWTSKFLTILA